MELSRAQLSKQGLCTQGEFARAQTTRERVRTGSAAITDLQAFIDFGERIDVPDPVLAAIADARFRIEGIRRRMAGSWGGHGKWPLSRPALTRLRGRPQRTGL